MRRGRPWRAGLVWRGKPPAATGRRTAPAIMATGITRVTRRVCVELKAGTPSRSTHRVGPGCPASPAGSYGTNYAGSLAGGAVVSYSVTAAAGDMLYSRIGESGSSGLTSFPCGNLAVGRDIVFGDRDLLQRGQLLGDSGGPICSSWAWRTRTTPAHTGSTWSA